MIEQNLEGKEIEAPAPRKPARVVNLMKALEESLKTGARKPPLKDLVPLANAFLRRNCKEYRRKLQLSRDASLALGAHTWPGDVAKDRSVGVLYSSLRRPHQGPETSSNSGNGGHKVGS